MSKFLSLGNSQKRGLAGPRFCSEEESVRKIQVNLELSCYTFPLTKPFQLSSNSSILEPTSVVSSGNSNQTYLNRYLEFANLFVGFHNQIELWSVFVRNKLAESNELFVFLEILNINSQCFVNDRNEIIIILQNDALIFDI